MPSLRLAKSWIGGMCAALVVSGCAADDGEDLAESEGAHTAEADYVPPPAYAEGKPLSDLTPAIIARLRAIHAGSGRDARVFVKVGDSITVSSSFLQCFATRPPALEARLEETRAFFSPRVWSRETRAARVGGHTNEVTVGRRSPVDREVAEMSPAFAVVMLGTNDVYEGTQPSYEVYLKRVVDRLVAHKVVPILSTIPPMARADKNVVIAKMNLIVRKVAAEASVPLMDFHGALEDLPRFGLSSDGVHPSEAETGACDFSGVAMNAGYNQRNLLTLRALDATRRAVLD
jgi:hypothetical protein